MKKRILFLMTVIFLAGACTTTRTTVRTIKATSSDIIVKPMLADVDVDVTKKVTGTATISGYIKARKTPVREVKKLAMYDALEKSGADILIDPIYKITKRFSSITVEVSGFYGKYTKIETVEQTELENLDLYTVPTNSDEEEGSMLKKRLKKMKKKKEK